MKLSLIYKTNTVACATMIEGDKMKVHIPEKYFSLFESVGVVNLYKEKANIYMHNEKSQYFYILKSGRIRVYISSAKGKEVTLDVLKKGRFFGDNSFLENAFHQTNIEAVTDIELIECKIENVIDIIYDHKDLMILVLQHLTQTTDYLTHQIHSLTMYDANQKVADFLLRTSENGRNSITYTHENIATCLNLNRVTVSRIMKNFQENGWIESDYGIVKIYDAKALSKLLEKN